MGPVHRRGRRWLTASLNRRYAAELQQRFDRAQLSPDDQLSYDLFLSRNARAESLFPYRDYGYVFDQMNGAQSDGPAFLINIHKVGSVADAEAYVVAAARNGALPRPGDRRSARSAKRSACCRRAGSSPTSSAIRATSSPARPFGGGKDSDVWADFKGKVAKLDADAATKQRLLASGRAALLNDVRPAYQRVIALMQQQQRKAGNDDGIWRFPNGAAQYRALTANLHDHRPDPRPDPRSRAAPHQAHPGRDERDHGPRSASRARCRNSSRHARTDPRFYSRRPAREYLAKTDAALKAMEARLPQYFATLAQGPAGGEAGRAVPREERRQGLLPEPRRPTGRGRAPITSASTT